MVRLFALVVVLFCTEVRAADMEWNFSAPVGVPASNVSFDFSACSNGKCQVPAFNQKESPVYGSSSPVIGNSFREARTDRPVLRLFNRLKGRCGRCG